MATTITQWNFNSPTPDNTTNTGTANPVAGTGTATLLGTTATFAAGLGSEADNSGWNTTSYPSLGTDNKAEGVQFNLATLGFTGINFNFDIRHSNTSANTEVVQYSIDGTNFIDFQTFTANNGDTWFNRSVDFSGITQLNNNPNAAFRVVAAFDPTTGNYRASTPTSNYAGTGTLRFDNVVFLGNAVTVTFPTINLSVSSNTANETDKTAITITATASSPVSGAQTVDLSVAGTGITTGDYTLNTTRITIPDGQTTGTATFTVVDDATSEGTETATISINNPSAGAKLGSTTSQNISITDNDFTSIRIHDIQGSSQISPLVNQTVNNVEGIVTGVLTGSSRGFWMQDPNPDNNNATSEGIFVFLGSSTTATPTVGQSVRVTGRVNEFRPGNNTNNLTTTQINASASGASVTQIASLGTITPTVLGANGRAIPNTFIQNDFTAANPGNVETGGDFDSVTEGIDFYESLEGMLVQVNNAVATSPTNDFGEIWILADNGANATGRTSRGGSLISPNDFNPERIQIDDTLFTSGTSPVVNVGATFGTITGVVSYDFNNYEVLPTSLNVTSPGSLTKETTNLTGNANNLTVAAFNVENLDPNDADGDTDVASGKFTALANNIVNNLKSPDIISLEEIQDSNGSTNNGVVDAAQTYNTLIAAIQAAGGPTYTFRQVNPENNQDGGQSGGNIRVGFLYNPARVSFVDRSSASSTFNTSINNLAGNPELSISPGRIVDTDLSDGDAFASSRKPLVGEFIFQGQSVFVIGNHFNSKGGDQPLYGPNQPPVLTTEAQRRQQAQIVNNFVDSILSVNANANIIVLGDLNDFEFSEPLNILKGTPGGVGNPVLKNLIDTLPANERYTYNFQGNAQVLDHILVSNGLFNKLNGYDIVHINSEFADQQSDHDPAVARFTITPQPKLNTYDFKNLPKLGTTITGRDIFLGGFSGLSFQGVAANGNLKFITNTDRGPNGENQGNLRPFFLPDFTPELVSFELNQNTGEISITNRTQLLRQDGVTPLTGLPNIQAGARGTAYTDEVGIDLNGNTLKNDPLGADLEGIVVAENGDYWMVDEYRPAIYNFDRNGRLIDRFIPAGTATDASKNGGTFYGTPSLPAVYAQRRNNRGFEAVALEGNKLYAFIQSAIDNPDDGGDTVSRSSNNLRILEFDIISKKVTGEYLYLLDDVTTADKIGDAVSLGNGKFAVVERDDNSDVNAKKLIYQIDLAGATNINGLTPAGKTIEQLSRSELAAANINPVSKNLIVNAASVGYTGVDKLEGLALVAPNTLALINDNDFNVAGTNTPEKLGLIQLLDNLPVATLNFTQTGTGADDTLFGNSGNDVINAGAGNNIIYAGEGNNILYGGAGNDVFYAGAGNDRFYAGDGNNTFYGGEGDNLYIAANGNNLAYAGSGNDVFAFGNGNNTIYAGEGNNRITTGNGIDLIYTGAGNDVITLGNGNKTIYAGEGNNQIITGNGNNLIYAGAGNDIIKTGAGDDVIYAGEGNNTISTGIGNDTAYVGSGSTRFILDAGVGSVNIYGYTADDSISRGSTLAANSLLSVSISGNDTLISAGSDLLATLKSTQLNSVNII